MPRPKGPHPAVSFRERAIPLVVRLVAEGRAKGWEGDDLREWLERQYPHPDRRDQWRRQTWRQEVAVALDPDPIRPGDKVSFMTTLRGEAQFVHARVIQGCGPHRVTVAYLKDRHDGRPRVTEETKNVFTSSLRRRTSPARIDLYYREPDHAQPRAAAAPHAEGVAGPHPQHSDMDE